MAPGVRGHQDTAIGHVEQPVDGLDADGLPREVTDAGCLDCSVSDHVPCMQRGQPGRRPVLYGV
jgi:hypothetical protein